MGFSKAMSAGWILLDKSAGAPTISRKVQSITDTIKVLLKRSKVGEVEWREIYYLCWTKIRPQGTLIVAIADFWRTFHHDGKIRPGW